MAVLRLVYPATLPVVSVHLPGTAWPSFRFRPRRAWNSIDFLTKRELTFWVATKIVDGRVLVCEFLLGVEERRPAEELAAPVAGTAAEQIASLPHCDENTTMERLSHCAKTKLHR
ncbi:hypothetical protein RLEG12_00795 (plasmid) [Rhizobium leguminosarum bv. trifolii CB782]|nr:hypothetical protein RLEG12_00795 [Rhizobium leguminosarum bv. trifolii CB782]